MGLFSKKTKVDRAITCMTGIEENENRKATVNGLSEWLRIILEKDEALVDRVLEYYPLRTTRKAHAVDTKGPGVMYNAIAMLYIRLGQAARMEHVEFTTNTISIMINELLDIADCCSPHTIEPFIELLVHGIRYQDFVERSGCDITKNGTATMLGNEDLEANQLWVIAAGLIAGVDVRRYTKRLPITLCHAAADADYINGAPVRNYSGDYMDFNGRPVASEVVPYHYELHWNKLDFTFQHGKYLVLATLLNTIDENLPCGSRKDKDADFLDITNPHYYYKSCGKIYRHYGYFHGKKAQYREFSNTYTYEQMYAIYLGLVRDIDTSVYENPIYTGDVMFEFMSAMCDGVDLTEYYEIGWNKAVEYIATYDKPMKKGGLFPKCFDAFYENSKNNRPYLTRSYPGRFMSELISFMLHEAHYDELAYGHERGIELMNERKIYGENMDPVNLFEDEEDF